jgi:hypothetical protein
MGCYRLYFLKAAELSGMDEIEAQDDFEAARIARSRSAEHMVEVWSGGRKIRTLGPSARSLS